jgi:UDP-N-acetyl-D-galactosamine dehydrogenase
MKLDNLKIAVIGLGYVGLPLAVKFGNCRNVVGFDLSEKRILELSSGIDHTNEVSAQELAGSKGLMYTSNSDDLVNCNCYIIAVPTPIDRDNKPNLQALLDASTIVGKSLARNDLVIYESTVYPGCTEEDCVPVLEQYSGLKFNQDFYCGYSPERINPGDKKHRIGDIKKVTSGSTEEVADLIDSLYLTIIEAGTYKASSIKVAEAAKIIENTQRDLNIALINEVSKIFTKLGIDTEEVLDAASSKWNFMPFKPGLVGGHCIGVDPYYLTQKAQRIGFNPEIILAGRRVNDGMGLYVASQLVKNLAVKGIPINKSKILIMGFTFKENCPDIRNTKVIDILNELISFGCNVDIYDPLVNDRDKKNYNFISNLEERNYDAIIIAVAHDFFGKMGPQKIRSYLKDVSILYDLKYLFKKQETDLRL